MRLSAKCMRHEDELIIVQAEFFSLSNRCLLTVDLDECRNWT